MTEKHWNRRAEEYLTCEAAEDEFACAAVAIGAHHKQACMEGRICFPQSKNANIAAVRMDLAGLHLQTMATQIICHPLDRGSTRLIIPIILRNTKNVDRLSFL